MSSASLIITLSTEIHQFLSERGSECELWKTLNDNDPLPVTGYNPAYAVYFYQFEVSSHYDYQALFTVISDFVENNYKGADFEHEDDIFEFMTDNFGLRLLTDYGDNTEHEGNFKSSLSIYIDIWDVETDQGTFNIISLDEMFVKDYGYGSMTLAGGKLLLRWLTAGEKLKDCFDELVRRCMTNELARLKPSECKKVTDNALYSDKPTLTVEFDITEARVTQSVVLLDSGYSEDTIEEGLRSGDLATTAWFNGQEGSFIQEYATGNKVAKILHQAIYGSYDDFIANEN